jgi:hypothetical protein
MDEVIKLLAEKAQERINLGRFNRFMSLEGHAALLCDKLQRWFMHRDDNEIEECAVDAFFILLKCIEEENEQAAERSK